MTDEQTKALEWLNKALRGQGLEYSLRSQHASTLIDMLAEPRLPAEPTREMLLAMATGWKVDPDDDYRGAYRALYAHLTAKPVEKRRLFHPDLEWLAERIEKLERDRT